MPPAVKGLICSVLLAIVIVIAAAGASAANSPRYYLALGDSLSQGVQPDAAGTSLETSAGYADQLFSILQKRIPNLRLVKLGCPGDTTASILTGHGNASNAAIFHCIRTGGSQLTAAERFLKSHHRKGEVALVTIDAGANNVDDCVKPGVNLISCVTTGVNAIKSDLPAILSRLAKAAPASATLAAMTLYDPFLADFFSTDPAMQALSTASVGLAQQVNTILTNADTAAGFKTADVAGAFATYDTSHTVLFGGRQIPLNVARVCSWTWECNTPPSGPNIHANKNGYEVIAGAFASAVGRLH
jgi:lysophospholipase L1-like esterase